MLVTLLGMVMLVRPVQSRNASLPDAGDAVADGDARQACSQKQPDAGDAVGMVMLVRQCSECEPMLVTLSGMVTLVRLLH